MKTKSFARALALVGSLFAAFSSSAVSLNPKGVGQVLIYPYYTVNKNQDTLISVTNTSGVGKVVRVQFIEGINGRDTLRFDLFLSPFDVWTAAISSVGDDDGAQISTQDRSCTYPNFPNGGVGPVAFRTDAFDGMGPFPGDGGPTGPSRTREGYVAMIAAGDIVPGSPTDARTRHVGNGSPGAGAPPGCEEINNTNVVTDIVVASNALYGSASIVNVGEGTYFAYNADAVAGFTDIPLIGSSAEIPFLLQDANSVEATHGVARAYLYGNDGRRLALDYAFGVDALSAIFMSDALYNEWLVDPSLGANTDWIVTFPTKNFYVDELYGDTPFPPFANRFIDGAADVDASVLIHDREEGSPELGLPIVPTAVLAYQVNAISFLAVTPRPGSPSGVLGSTLTSTNVQPYGTAGTVALGFATGDGNGHRLPGGMDPDGNEVTLIGLPATGFMVYNIINTQAQPGMLANYGGAFHHRATMSCAGPASACDATNSRAQSEGK